MFFYGYQLDASAEGDLNDDRSVDDDLVSVNEFFGLADSFAHPAPEFGDAYEDTNSDGHAFLI